MVMETTIFEYSSIPQDTLIRMQQRQDQPLPGIAVPQKQINFKRAEEVIKQFELRELEMISEKPVVVSVKPKPQETLRKPSIEVDTLMAKYQHIGCSPRPAFPDTFNLTILERYYQPIASDQPPVKIAEPSTVFSDQPPVKIAEPSTVFSPDSMPVFTPATTAETATVQRGFVGEDRQGGFPSSVTILIIFGLVILAFIKYQFRRYMSDTFRSVFSFRRSMRLFEESRDTVWQAVFLSNFFFTYVTGIFISLSFPILGAKPLWDNYTFSILFFSVATGLIYFLKARIWNILGVIFNVKMLSKLYIHNMFLYNRNTGFIIFPFVAILPYISENFAHVLLFCIIFIFVIFYLIRLFSIFQIIHDQNVSVFYFILYLCTLEILPVLILIKICKILSEFNLV